MTTEKELVWLPSNLAKMFNDLEGKTAEDYILAAYEARCKGIEEITALLDDDILTFKAKGIAYKRAFAEAVEGEKEALYILFQAAETELHRARTNAKAHAAEVKNLLQDVQRQTSEVNNALKALDAWRVTETVEKLNALHTALATVTPKTQQVLRLLLSPGESE